MRPPLRSLANALLFVAAALCSGGCVATGGINQTVFGQRLLDKYLSPGFTGDLDIREDIPLYLRVTLEGKNLRREETGWRYDWIEYNASAHLQLGKRP